MDGRDGVGSCRRCPDDRTLPSPRLDHRADPTAVTTQVGLGLGRRGPQPCDPVNRNPLTWGSDAIFVAGHSAALRISSATVPRTICLVPLRPGARSAAAPSSHRPTSRPTTRPFTAHPSTKASLQARLSRGPAQDSMQPFCDSAALYRSPAGGVCACLTRAAAEPP